MGILEMPHGGCNVNGRRESDRLSQCLVCGSLIWSGATHDETECRCSIADVVHDVAETPELADFAS
ncbi:MAG: hypothetical protein WD178_08520 [Actinomycetota bacterium]